MLFLLHIPQFNTMLWFLNIVCCAAAGAKAAETRCAVSGAVAVEEESCCVTKLAPFLHTDSLVLKNSTEFLNLDCNGRCKTYKKKGRAGKELTK